MFRKSLSLLFIWLAAACAPVAQAAPKSSPSSVPSATDAQVATPTATQGKIAKQYADLGPAPEIHNTTWINTDGPLTIAGLQGKVVLLEMWTFDCINCQHVMPALKSWYARYQNQGFVIIGNHFPEFDFERDLGNLKDAVKQDGITYPVAQDNDGATWNAYHNAYWPTAYLIDKRGHIRYEHIGEGAYAETEAAIQALLAEPG